MYVALVFFSAQMKEISSSEVCCWGILASWFVYIVEAVWTWYSLALVCGAVKAS
jgi:hypothetical protein